MPITRSSLPDELREQVGLSALLLVRKMLEHGGLGVDDVILVNMGP